MAVLHRAHTSGFFSALEQLPHSLALPLSLLASGVSRHPSQVCVCQASSREANGSSTKFQRAKMLAETARASSIPVIPGARLNCRHVRPCCPWLQCLCLQPPVAESGFCSFSRFSRVSVSHRRTRGQLVVAGARRVDARRTMICSGVGGKRVSPNALA